MALMSAGNGSAKVKTLTHSQSYEGVPTSYTLQYDAKTVILRYNRAGYEGSALGISGAGFSSLGSFDCSTQHSFGTWGQLWCIAYATNKKKGEVVTLTNSGNINNGGNIYAVYLV